MSVSFVDNFNNTLKTLKIKYDKEADMFTVIEASGKCTKCEFNMKKYTTILEALKSEASKDKKDSKEAQLITSFEEHKSVLKKQVAAIHKDLTGSDDVASVLVRTHLSKVYTSAYFFFSLHALSLGVMGATSKFDTKSKAEKEATDKYTQLVKFVTDAMPLLFSSIDTELTTK